MASFLPQTAMQMHSGALRRPLAAAEPQNAQGAHKHTCRKTHRAHCVLPPLISEQLQTQKLYFPPPPHPSSLTLHSAPPSHRLCCCFPLPFPFFIFLPLISWAAAWSINRHPRSQPSIERERADNNRVREDKRQEEHKYRQQVLITHKRLTTQSGKTSWNWKNALKKCVCACARVLTDHFNHC